MLTIRGADTPITRTYEVDGSDLEIALYPLTRIQRDALERTGLGLLKRAKPLLDALRERVMNEQTDSELDPEVLRGLVDMQIRTQLRKEADGRGQRDRSPEAMDAARTVFCERVSVRSGLQRQDPDGTVEVVTGPAAAALLWDYAPEELIEQIVSDLLTDATLDEHALGNSLPPSMRQ